MTQSTRALAAQELQLFKAAFFKALAHPIRIRILERLVGQDHTVQELQEALQLSQPVVVNCTGLGAGQMSPLGRALPLDYASVGPAGAMLGYWISRGWERAKETDTPEVAEG